jgi:two-component system, LytTR family, sensor kinase
MNQRWVHLTLWGTYATFLYLFFFDEANLQLRLLQALAMVGSHAALFYIHQALLMPTLLERRRHVAYGFAVLGLLLLYVIVPGVVIALNSFAMPFEGPRPLLGPSDIPHPRPAFAPHFGRIASLHLFWLLSILFLSSSDYQARKRREQEKAAITHANRILEADLGRLRAQVNPHFLMNALNNIYALSELQSKEAPQAILNLSNMMQYVLYECSQPWTRLSREIDYLQHYIALQCLRDESFARNIALELPDAGGLHGEIIPMTLITFVENAFKHSHIEDDAHGWIRIAMRIQGARLHFSCSNSLPLRAHQKAEIGGIGIQNVRQRLAYTYPNEHTLELQLLDDSFSVTLEIPIRHGL